MNIKQEIEKGLERLTDQHTVSSVDNLLWRMEHGPSSGKEFNDWAFLCRVKSLDYAAIYLAEEKRR